MDRIGPAHPRRLRPALPGERHPLPLLGHEPAFGGRRPDDGRTRLRQRAEPLLALPHAPFQPVADGDIGHHHAGPRIAAGPVGPAYRIEAHQELPRLVRPRRVHGLHLGVRDRPPALEHALQLGGEDVLPFRHRIPQVGPDRGAQRAAAHRGQRTVHVADTQRPVEQPEADRRVLQHVLQQRAGSPEVAPPSPCIGGHGGDSAGQGQRPESVEPILPMLPASALRPVRRLRLDACHLRTDQVHRLLAAPARHGPDSPVQPACPACLDPGAGHRDLVLDRRRQAVQRDAQPVEQRKLGPHHGYRRLIRLQVLRIAREHEAALPGFDILERRQQALGLDGE